MPPQSKLVVSGGYSRTYDPIFMNLYLRLDASAVTRRAEAAARREERNPELRKLEKEIER